MYFIYIIKSDKSGRYYVGYTNDIIDRLRHHNSGATRSTKSGIPWKIVHTESFPDKKSAWLREREIKSYEGGEAFKKLVV